MKTSLLVFASLLALVPQDLLRAAEASHPLTIDQLMRIKHPSDPLWSPDGKYVAFISNEAGVANLYLAGAAASGGAEKALTSFSKGKIADAFWSGDSHNLYFPHEGALWQVDIAGGQAHVVSEGAIKGTSFLLSPDGQQLALVRKDGPTGTALFVRSLASGKEKQIATDAASIQLAAWSPDGMHLAYTAGAKIVHHDQTPAYSGAKITYQITEHTPGRLLVANLSGGEAVNINVPPAGRGEIFWLDRQHIVFDRESEDFKKRSIYTADVTNGKITTAHEDVDAKFWSMPYNAGYAGQPSPDGQWIAFVSDRDGWDRVYLMPAKGGSPRAISKEGAEAWRPKWSHDSKRLSFDANSKEQPGDRQLYVATVAAGEETPRVEAVTSGRGTNVEPAWAPDDQHLVYQHTDTQNSADLFTIAPHSGSTPQRMSHSMPADMDHNAFIEPQYVHYPGADGQPVPGWLFVPKNLDRSKQHPAIVWIHGDGINQNYDGWHVQRNYAVYYSFHQYLLQQGYVVFAPDYRGSIGYGRDWRQGVYMDVGGKDATDAWMAARYLNTLGYVDSKRIGVWGLSYGGFFTLIAMTSQPTLYKTGVDVAGVVDYEMYYEDPYHGGWTESRIGKPEDHPEVYKNASPLSHIDQLKHPLLILHGTADVNVPYLESVRLIDEGLKKNKGDLMQFMMYPGEFHYFEREQVLKDAWRRVDEFFWENLCTPADK